MKIICGAHALSTGKPCQAPPVPGEKRCKLHGGLSTGPRIAEGKRRISLQPPSLSLENKIGTVSDAFHSI